MKDVVIIGAGIAGLTAAYELSKDSVDFHVIETSDRVGGNIKTKKVDGFSIEEGPYTLTSSGKDVLGLVSELGLDESLVEAKSESKNRYIYHQKKLIPVPMSPKELYKTELLSSDGKKTLLEEFFISKVDKEETIEEFVSRRFGREVLKNLVQPFLCGVYAGDVKKLSANAVFPKLKEIESKFKSVLIGLPLSKGLQFKKDKHTIYSFKEGMEQLPKEIYKRIQKRVSLSVSKIEVVRAKDYFVVTYEVGGKTISYTTNAVLFATPAYTVLNYSHLLPNKKSIELFETEYLPLATVSQIVDKSKVKTKLDGFGYLCTKEPHRKLLGTIWTSSIFPQGNDKALLSSFIGGAYFPKVASAKESEVKNQVSKEVAEILKISKPSELKTINYKLYPKAIPQYYLGHGERVSEVEKIMDSEYGLFFTGNYLYGISINDTVKTSKKMVNKIKVFLEKVKLKSKDKEVQVSKNGDKSQETDSEKKEDLVKS